MQIVSYRDNLHEIPMPISGNKKSISKYRLLKVLSSMLNVNHF